MLPTANSLVDPYAPNWEGCEYSKCGRTDKGVSAFGQVIGIRVRSDRPLCKAWAPTSENHALVNEVSEKAPHDPCMEIVAPPIDRNSNRDHSVTPDTETDGELSFHPINDEIPYCQVLNRLLPPDIRMLAWCPDPPPDFSARFSCKERRYKYFFTQPAFTPTIGSAGLRNPPHSPDSRTALRREGYLDIAAMREAAHKFIGLHDFRNFCKLDASKQIENFERRIFHADIEEIDSQQGPVGYISKSGFQQFEHSDDSSSFHPDTPNKGQLATPTLYAFTLHGSAFLWHQVRHMVGILFLIGQGLEQPSLVDELLNIEKTPGKYQYEMADGAPLVLWDCIFPSEDSVSREDALEWVYVGDYAGDEGGIATPAAKRVGGGKYGLRGVVDDLWKVWRGRKMDEILVGSLLDVVVAQGNGGHGKENEGGRSKTQKVFQGGNGPRLVGRYTPVKQKPRMESVQVLNERYAKRKGLGPREKSTSQA